MTAGHEPVPPLDAVALIDAYRSATGENLTMVGLAGAGQVGAAFVRRADGTEAVLSRGSAGVDALERAGRALAMAQEHGLPVPRYLRVVDTAAGVALLQQRLSGVLPERVDEPLVRQLLRFADRLTGRLTDATWLSTPRLYLDADGPGFCLHGPLAGYDRRTRRLLDWVRRVGESDGSSADGDDLVHLDLHPGNVLIGPGGGLVGVIDWDTAGRGDARIALATLLFDLAWGQRFDGRYAGAAAAVGLVAERFAAVEAPRRRMLWAHMSLRQVDWSIRHHSAEVVEHFVSVAEDGIGRYGLG